VGPSPRWRFGLPPALLLRACVRILLARVIPPAARFQVGTWVRRGATRKTPPALRWYSPLTALGECKVAENPGSQRVGQSPRGSGRLAGSSFLTLPDSPGARGDAIWLPAKHP